jgi:hypothetical protein
VNIKKKLKVKKKRNVSKSGEFKLRYIESPEDLFID